MISRDQVTDADRTGLTGIFSFAYRGEAFIRCQARKAADCWYCDTRIYKGEAIWRPMGNGKNRMRRLHDDCGLAIVLTQAGVQR